MKTLILAVAVIAAPAAAAAPHTGSGTVSFAFTGFSGPFAQTLAANDPADAGAWLSVGAINGVVPSFTGSAVVSNPNVKLVVGAAAVSGTSADFVYIDAYRPNPIHNIVSFTPAAFSDVTQGQNFTLGTMGFTNGQWYGGDANPLFNVPLYLDFTLSTASATAAFNQTITGRIKVVTNVAAGYDCTQPQVQRDEADFLTVDSSANLGSTGSLRVYDQLCKPAGATNFGSIDLIAQFGSLHIAGFANPGGSGFYSPSGVPGPLPVGGVPEPATWALLVAGFGIAGLSLRRRTQRSESPIEPTAKGLAR